MPASVFTRSVRDHRRSLMVWALAVIAYTLMIAAFYPSLQDSMASYQAIIDSMPAVVRDAFAGSDMSSPAGWLDYELFSIMAPVAFLVYAVAAGGRGIAGEEEQGTLDLLLAHPVSRGRVLLEKYAEMLAGVILLTLAQFASLVASSWIWGLRLGLVPLLEASALLGLVGLAFGSIAFLVGAASGHRGLASGVAGGLAGAMYLLNVLAPQSQSLERLQPLSLFHYYGTAPLSSGLSGTGAAVLLLTSAACTAVAYVAFSRRDVA